MARRLCCWTLVLCAAALARGFRVSDNEISLADDESSVEQSSIEGSWREEVATSREEEKEEQTWFRCPSAAEDGGLHPDPRNCSSFVQCSNGRPHVMPCPKGLHYSEQEGRCEQPCDAYCNATLSCSCKWPTCDLPKLCFLPKEKGPCRAAFLRYFFNKRSGQCEKFIYGGCRGNENNFENKEACQQRCSKVGTPEEETSPADEEFDSSFRCPPQKNGLFPNPRNCSSFVQCSNGRPHVMPCPAGLHYSAKAKRCEVPCKAFCNRTLSCECKWPTCGLPAPCFPPAKTGPCRASFRRWFFDARSGKCQRFTYGGCRANANNFDSLESCRRLCRKVRDESSVEQSSIEESWREEVATSREDEEAARTWFRCPSTAEDGGLFPNPRNCSSFVQCSNGHAHVMPCPAGLHYSAKAKRCEVPCKAFCNRTLSCECKWPTCGLPAPCFPPAKTGPCRAAFRRWFFDARSGKCQRFTYGGCRANANNFDSLESCRRLCRKVRDESSVEQSSLEESWREEVATSREEEKEEQTWFKCPSAEEDGGLFPDPRNCSSFVQCSSGRPHVMPCPKGLHYSEQEGRCEQPCDAYCNATLSCECKWPTCGLPHLCFLPNKTGPCRGRIPRFFFDKKTGECEKFLYGGCRGNENNFYSKELCQRRCSKACPLAPHPADCALFLEQCAGEQPRTARCAEGLAFDAQLLRCVPRLEVECASTIGLT